MSDLVQQLANRLPELEWKLSCLGSSLKPSLLPRGLFRSRLDFSSQSCIEEIKMDLQTMRRLSRSGIQNSSRNLGNERSIEYLAVRVEQKINVLVRICQQSIEKKTPQREVYFGVQTINTPQHSLHPLPYERKK